MKPRRIASRRWRVIGARRSWKPQTAGGGGAPTAQVLRGSFRLQRPFELAPREVLSDGQLGSGCVAQLPPDHLQRQVRHAVRHVRHVRHVRPD
ncbi:hypothetical protein EYF80_059057 [Liparis tanakae]|uniref:Uncharacterized protein n=1 Tax=Liparis tanakae TaxID=230148 RepID=A0A4Z2ER72_9TELE|nr:hypothetical protein EYF80_059057 [Liparis tanakae]